MPLLLFSCIACLLLLICNAFDAAPGAAAQRLQAIAFDGPAPPDAHNAYLHLSGFDAPAGEDPRQLGRQRIAAAPGRPHETDHDAKAVRSPETQALLAACARPDSTCASALETGSATLDVLLRDEDWRLARYRELLAHPAWHDPTLGDHRAPLPAFAPVLDAQTLLFARAWQLAAAGDADGARSLLEADARYWRMVLVEAKLLLPKMIAAGALERHFSWGSLVLRRAHAAGADATPPPAWTQPMSLAERSLMRSAAGEWALFASGMRVLPHDPQAAAGDVDADPRPPSLAYRWSMRLLFLPQDTINRHAELLVARTARLDDADFGQLPSVLAQADEAAGDDVPLTALHPRNPIGKVVLNVAQSSFAPYAARLADLEGLRRAALLNAELRLRALPRSGLASAVAGAALRNPYDDKPFAWDDAAAELVFTGLASGKRGTYTLLH